MKAFSLPKYCQEKDLGYKKLAELLSVSETYACQLRSGEKPVTLRVAMRLKEILGLPLERLLPASNGKGNGRRHQKTKKVSAGVGRVQRDG